MRTEFLSRGKVGKVHKVFQIKDLGVCNRWFKAWDGLAKGENVRGGGVASSFFQPGVTVTDG